MTRLFRSKSCGLGVRATGFDPAPPSPSLYLSNDDDQCEDEDGEEEDEEEEEFYHSGPISTPLISPASCGERREQQSHQQYPILALLVAALRKSLVTCSVDREDLSSGDIGWPTDVRHVSHVTFDRFNGFLGLPLEFQPDVPTRVPSASASVFGVSARSMQCSYDRRGNSIPTILLLMQKRLYAAGGLQAEGIFRINAENGQEEHVRNQLNKGIVPPGIDVHCLAGLIKAWFRELPSGVLDFLSPEQVMHCNTEDDCTELVKLLPPTEAALLDWAVNLMADVVENEHYNKMNARNIAMVFAPNMTQMADPLTALIHAVQVMNFLKTLITKTLHQREKSAAKARVISSCAGSPRDNGDTYPLVSNRGTTLDQTLDGRGHEGPAVDNHQTATINADRLELDMEKGLWNDLGGEIEIESVSDGSTGCTAVGCEKETSKDCGSEYDRGEFEGIFYRLSLSKGVRKLCRHPVFQLSKPAKKTRGLGIVNTRGGGGEAWA
ncbi:rho GTPase-activating protein 3 [Malania oleifera]|uniref:rho GTPase-activating protein 3 n=1 Tax=Malania oleifera TaxID=397392 RepID=UPI0025ADB3A1|nr:rho GTPase-activating protein 3 [Malania oleifera]XP_057980541.1 rho GTPase-activating protein 3 [Malania oleifera]